MPKRPIRILTYGTFDLFHIGHLRILERARELGDELYVGVSTDTFNSEKGKRSTICFEQRLEIIAALRCVTLAFPERRWQQKLEDVVKLKIDCFVMGDDWIGKFDFLRAHCDVKYLPKTPQISSSEIKSTLHRSHGPDVR